MQPPALRTRLTLASPRLHPAGHKLLADPSRYAALESDLVFLGVAGLQDPPRPEVRAAIHDCHAAGIRLIVITGDNKLTAEVRPRRWGVVGGGLQQPVRQTHNHTPSAPLCCTTAPAGHLQGHWRV